MKHLQQVVLAAALVMLGVFACWGQTQNPTHVSPTRLTTRKRNIKSITAPVDYIQQLYQYMYELLQQLIVSNTAIADCATTYLNITAMVTQISSEFPAGLAENASDQYIKVITEISCRDYISQFLTCFEREVHLGTSRLEVMLQNNFEFSRFHAMTRYFCMKFDVIIKNMDCVQDRLNGIMPFATPLNMSITSRLQNTGTERLNLTNAFTQGRLKKMLQLSLEYRKNIRPIIAECGQEYLEVFDHMLQETYLLYRGARFNSGLQTSKKTFLLHLVVLAAVVSGHN